MAGAVAGFQIGQLTARFGALGAQTLDHLGVQGRGGVFAVRAIGQLLLGGVHLGVLLGLTGLGLGQLLVEVGHLLLGQAGPHGRHQAVGRPVLGHLGFGLLNLHPQLRQPVVQPAAGLLGGVELGFQLLQQIVIGEGVGDQGGPGRILRLEIDADDIGQAGPADGEPGQHAVDHPLQHLALLDRSLVVIGELGLLRREQAESAMHRRPGGAHDLGDDGRLAQPAIELRILVQLEVLHHAGRQGAGLEDFHLGIHRAGVGRQTRQHRIDVGHIAFARVDHDVGGSRIARGLLEAEHHRPDHHSGHHSGEQPEPPPEGGDQLMKIDIPRPLGRGFHVAAVYTLDVH